MANLVLPSSAFIWLPRTRTADYSLLTDTFILALDYILHAFGLSVRRLDIILAESPSVIHKHQAAQRADTIP